MLPLLFIAVALAVIVYDAVHRRVRWYLIAWFVIAASAFLPQWPLWSFDSIRTALPLWFWQLVLLPTGIAMAVRPLLGSMRLAAVERPSTPSGVGL